MTRSERRRQAKEFKKELGQKSVAEIQDFIKQKYIDGVNDTTALHKEALKELFGFGDSRYSRVQDYVVEQLVKDGKIDKKNVKDGSEDGKEA